VKLLFKENEEELSRDEYWQNHTNRYEILMNEEEYPRPSFQKVD
jgi:hypothetical protein